MIKKIELELHFDDDFVPPEKFIDDTSTSRSPCSFCPFFVWYDEYGYGECVALEKAEQFDKCPIKKFFD